jgi:hypothetical protein
MLNNTEAGEESAMDIIIRDKRRQLLRLNLAGISNNKKMLPTYSVKHSWCPHTHFGNMRGKM